MLRVLTTLPDDVEQLVHDTIGCCIEVHRQLGPGLPERAYAKAIGLELIATGICFEREKRYEVEYRGELLCSVYLDFIVADGVVLEVKAVQALAAIHHAQVLNYMRIARLRAGLLINFNVAVLKEGIRRKVL